MDVTGLRIRQARHDDYDAVVAFTENTWPDRDGSDYIPRIYHDWIDGDGPDQHTFVVEAGDDVAGIAQGVLLSEYEGWAQGMRVNPAFRGRGISKRLTHAVFDWARERGATVVRNMVFSWNSAGLGQSRAAGFEPATEFRWAQPEPDATAEPTLDITADADAAWSCWTTSAARDHLKGLALDREESWAVSELTRADLRHAADDDRLLVVQDGGTRGLAVRVRDYERPDEDGEPVHWAEYAVGAWDDVESARSLFAAVRADAADVGADQTRVLIPETVRHVSDAARCRVDVSADPDFVLAADVTAPYRE